MAAINEFYLTAQENQAVNLEVARNGPLSDAAQAVINHAAWQWYEAHRSMRIFKKRILFWVIDLDLGDLEGVWTVIFGPKPAVL